MSTNCHMIHTEVIMNKNNKEICIYTDGACEGNPGRGGWGAILCSDGHEKEISGAQEYTTNNQMELMAVIKAIEAIKAKRPIHIYTDSQYVQKGMVEWLEGWKAKGWKTAQKKPVKNKELWQKLDEIQQGYDISWHWVKGHAGHEMNERADQLAKQAILTL